MRPFEMVWNSYMYLFHIKILPTSLKKTSCGVSPFEMVRSPLLSNTCSMAESTMVGYVTQLFIPLWDTTHLSEEDVLWSESVWDGQVPSSLCIYSIVRYYPPLWRRHLVAWARLRWSGPLSSPTLAWWQNLLWWGIWIVQNSISTHI